MVKQQGLVHVRQNRREGTVELQEPV
jgi:hypothetical protein